MDPTPDHKVSCETTTHGAATVVTLKGRLDALRLDAVRQMFMDLPEKGSAKLVVDLSGLEWIDSSGVGALITLYKRARTKGGDVKVAGLQRQPKEIFRLLRLESAFEVFDTVELALARFGG